MGILSIQSRVIYGHVGNDAAILPLQRQGFEVWAMPSAILSAHPGYGGAAVQPIAATMIEAWLAALERLGIWSQARAALTGWLGSAANGAAGLAAIARMKAARPGLPYLCDPVIGDRAEGVYVAPDMIDFFRDRALPAADIATPNHFEAEILTGRRIGDIDDALAAAAALRALGPARVVITSLDFGHDDRIETLATGPEGAWLAATPRLIDPPKGPGDMLSAMLLARLLHGDALPDALGFAVGAVFGVLRHSVDAGSREPLVVAAQDEFVRPGYRPAVVATAAGTGRTAG
jgi:pyridoxine kinase